MENNSTGFEVELLCVIINCGMGSKVIKHAKKHGVTGGTIFLGKGTVKSSLLQFLELAEVRKEVVWMLAEKSNAYNALEELNKKFRFHKPNHGIAFTTSIMGILGAKRLICEESRGVENPMYNVIVTVVDRGKGEFVVDAANKAGSRGATIINARGSGIHETSKVFSIEIEPEKEIVMIISEKDTTQKIVSSIKEDLQIEKPGNGVIFIQDINETYGLY